MRTMGSRAETTAATRDGIVRVACDLFLERTYEDITLAEIAAAAGVSHQTVLNHFESKQGVMLAVAEVMRLRTAEIRGKAKPGDVKNAVTVLVRHYELIGDANARWAMSAERLASLATLLDEARAGHQEWLRRIFGDRLPADAVANNRTVNALHAATDVYTWKLLRRDLGLSRAETEKIMVVLVTGILEPER
jgi:AcrR family transcriptional regulator